MKPWTPSFVNIALLAMFGFFLTGCSEAPPPEAEPTTDLGAADDSTEMKIEVVAEETPSESAAEDAPAEKPAEKEVASAEEPTAEPVVEPVKTEPVKVETEPAKEEPQEEETPKEEPEPQPAEEEKEEPPAETEVAKTEPPAEKTESKGVVSGDWSMWGGDISRNMINTTTGLKFDFDIDSGRNVAWQADLGSQTYGNPIVHEGKVYVGTNNGHEYRPQHKGDRGCVICFDEKTGEFLWQLTREKLPQGRVNDWPEQGICSTPCLEGERMWVITNRAELMCVDTNGFKDGENDGPYKEEADTEDLDADIIWSLDMIEELGVFPHNLATSSPVVYEDLIFLVTSNGVDEAHLEIPSPRAPSFLAVNKNTGEVAWEFMDLQQDILHGQWGSPAIGVIDGVAQVYLPGGDGWLYSLNAKTGEEIWRFDLNPKDSTWELGGLGSRNAIISTPVFYENSVVLGVGQDPEHGEGVGHLYRIDATKTGDVTAVTPDGEPNENSGEFWHYGGMDIGGKVTGDAENELFRRTISTVAIKDGLVYAADLSGRLHCVDFETGQRKWEYDLFAAVWGSPVCVDGKILIGDEDGDLAVLPASAEEPTEEDETVFTFTSSIYSTPTIANGVMFVTDRSNLYAIPVK